MSHAPFLLLLLALVNPRVTQDDDDPVLQGRTLMSWVKDLHSSHPEKRLPALAVMGALGPKARPQLPYLARIARDDKKGETRVALAQALGNIGGEDAFAVLLLMQEDQDANVRAVVAAAQHKVCPTPSSRIRALVTARLYGENDVRLAAYAAFGQFGPKKEAVPDLIELLADDEQGKRRAACEALQHFGPEGEEAVPALAKMLTNRQTRLNATVALGEIKRRPEIVVPALIELFTAGERLHRQERQAIVRTLRKYGPQAAPALPMLRKVLDDPDKKLDPLLQVTVAAAVANIDTENKDALAVLRRILRKNGEDLQCLRAIDALGELGPRAGCALPELQQLAKSTEPNISTAARWALLRIDLPQKLGWCPG